MSPCSDQSAEPAAAPGSRRSSASWRRWALLPLWLAAVAGPAEDAQAATPATQAATHAADSFQQALRLTDRQDRLLMDIGDRVEQLDEAAFYAMLAKAAEIGQIPDQPLEVLDRPSLGSLLAEPRRYRGRPVRLSVRVARIERLTAADGLTANPYWPADRPVWKLGCLGASGGIYSDTALLVFAAAEPASLGEPDEFTPRQERIYHPSRDVEVAGFFYKVRTCTSEDGKVRDFPVILAWRVDRAGQRSVLPGAPAGARDTFFLVLAALLVGYFFARRWAGRKGQADRPYRYRPLRREMEDAAGSDVEADPIETAGRRPEKEEGDDAENGSR